MDVHLHACKQLPLSSTTAAAVFVLPGSHVPQQGPDDAVALCRRRSLPAGATWLAVRETRTLWHSGPATCGGLDGKPRLIRWQDMCHGALHLDSSADAIAAALYRAGSWLPSASKLSSSAAQRRQILLTRFQPDADRFEVWPIDSATHPCLARPSKPDTALCGFRCLAAGWVHSSAPSTRARLANTRHGCYRPPSTCIMSPSLQPLSPCLLRECHPSRAPTHRGLPDSRRRLPLL